MSNMRFALLLQCFAAIWLTSEACEAPFIELSTGCYYFSENGKTWYQSLKDCIDKGAHLVSIETAEENDAIRRQLNRTAVERQSLNDWWVGGTDAAQEGFYQWSSTFAQIGYTDWSPGDPNNVNVENCIHITPYADYHWEDFSCNCPYDNYICEI